MKGVDTLEAAIEFARAGDATSKKASEALLEAVRAALEFRFTYAEIENVLVEIFADDESARSQVRARYKHFQKLNIPNCRPARGSKGKYYVRDFCEIILAMELSELGLDPQIVSEFIYHLNEGHTYLSVDPKSVLSRFMLEVISFDRAFIRPSLDEVYFVFSARLMSGRWIRDNDDASGVLKTFKWVMVEGEDIGRAVISMSQVANNTTNVVNLSALAMRVSDAFAKYVVR